MLLFIIQLIMAILWVMYFLKHFTHICCVIIIIIVSYHKSHIRQEFEKVAEVKNKRQIVELGDEPMLPL